MIKAPGSIPNQYNQFYTEAQHQSREIRLRLWQAVQEQKLQECSALEQEILVDAFETIARRGFSVLVTHDEEAYKTDLERMQNSENPVYLLCDTKFNLLDINPLLQFVSDERRTQYERIQRISKR